MDDKQNRGTMPSSHTTQSLAGCEHAATIDFAGEQLNLLPERAVWWPAERSLFVADMHIGKEASFRAAGLPVPDIFGSDLSRLSTLIARFKPEHVFILGDLLHDRNAHGPDVIRTFSAWRQATPEVRLTLVRGNHDRRAGDPPSDWNIKCVDEPALHNTLQLRHVPRPRDSSPTLAGHLHPKYRMFHGPDQLRLPCYLRRGNTLILPAFADFIDHAVIALEPGDSIFVVAGPEVIQIDAQSSASSNPGQ